MIVNEAVKALRKRLRKKQVEFASMLGCRPNTVSRYELGSFVPGPLVLMRLLQIADAAGLRDVPEREAIMRELKMQYDRGLFGGGKNLQETAALVGPLLVELQRSNEILSVLPEEKRRDYGFRQFIPAVAHVIEACDTVDQSVTDILQLWAAHARKEGTPRIFRDALGFLRAQLWPRGTLPLDHKHTRGSPAKR